MGTLKEAVEYVSDIVAPGRCPINSRGELDPETVRALNAAGRVLSKEGEWADLLQNITINTIDHRIVLPEFIASIRAAKIDNFHQEIRSPYYFHAQGTGGRDPASHQFGDAGNLVHEGVFPVQHDLEEPSRLCVLFSEGNAGESNTVVIAGLNSSKAPVREILSPTVGGALLATVNEYSEVSSITKTATTSGVTRVMPYDGDASFGFPIVTMLPWETSGSYRRYLVAGLPEGSEAEIFALVKLGWNREYVSPEERLPIDNFFALRTMVQALRALDNGNQRAYAELRSLAVGHMDKASVEVSNGQAIEVDLRIRSKFSRSWRRGGINRGSVNPRYRP